ncbi:hypothetical protein [Flagellimonas algicola]|uniref:DUF3899 domain-containing protein n=1 Tax=Flagellimonas algicola TaxID=2583815 RepID=A0ABY2WJ12_9FLAO|nr:hypothetical protein [Allomuricauda algicola]TMU54837.1 hypothetical protein FGG15_11610 [Allomuricauda algicola]
METVAHHLVCFMFYLVITTSIQSWYEGFYAAALGLSVLVGIFYIVTYGYRFIKSSIENRAAKQGIHCKVLLQRTQTIWYSQPKQVTKKQRVYFELLLFLHVFGLILTGILWLGLMVGLAMYLQIFS